MISFYAQQTEAVRMTAYVKNEKTMPQIFFKLYQLRKKQPDQVYKVDACPATNMITLVINRWAVPLYIDFFTSHDCTIAEKEFVACARPILEATDKEIVLLPATAGIHEPCPEGF